MYWGMNNFTSLCPFVSEDIGTDSGIYLTDTPLSRRYHNKGAATMVGTRKVESATPGETTKNKP